jgi:hypothetical protein
MFMKITPGDLIHALKDNCEIWKVILPLLLGGLIAGLAIVEFAFAEPLLFSAWSVTCLISGGLAHRWWFRQASDHAREWS